MQQKFFDKSAKTILFQQGFQVLLKPVLCNLAQLIA